MSQALCKTATDGSADVTPSMRVFRDEVFGPVLSVIRWSDEEQLWRDVNSLEVRWIAAVSRPCATAFRIAHGDSERRC